MTMEDGSYIGAGALHVDDKFIEGRNGCLMFMFVKSIIYCWKRSFLIRFIENVVFNNRVILEILHESLSRR